MVKISILMENSGSGHRGLVPEHDLSMLIEDHGHNVLFDTGSTDKFMFNARLMRKNLTNVETVVLSHCHYDHTGGFPAFIEQWSSDEKLLVTGKDFFLDRFETNSFSYTYLGIPFSSEDLEQHDIGHEEFTGILQLAPHCYAVSGFQRHNNIEKVPEKFVKYKGSEYLHDEFSEEVCIVVETANDIHILVGCAHFGILNIVAHVRTHFSKPIKGVYGGIHLMNSNESEIHTVLDGLAELGVNQYGLCHCSGSLVTDCLKASHRHDTYADLSVGDIITLG